MKILVCTDGSEHSKKAIEKASIIAGQLNADEVAIIHLYDGEKEVYPPFFSSDIQEEHIKMLAKEREAKRKEIISEGLKIFKDNNINARPIIKEWDRDQHPSDVILNVASEEGFEMIIMGSRGLGSLKKLFLGSVSNAVTQEAQNCIVVLVK